MNIRHILKKKPSEQKGAGWAGLLAGWLNSREILTESHIFIDNLNTYLSYFHANIDNFDRF